MHLGKNSVTLKHHFATNARRPTYGHFPDSAAALPVFTEQDFARLPNSIHATESICQTKSPGRKTTLGIRPTEYQLLYTLGDQSRESTVFTSENSVRLLLKRGGLRHVRQVD